MTSENDDDSSLLRLGPKVERPEDKNEGTKEPARLFHTFDLAEL